MVWTSIRYFGNPVNKSQVQIDAGNISSNSIIFERHVGNRSTSCRSGIQPSNIELSVCLTPVREVEAVSLTTLISTLQ
jgi:hypothetical protein